MSINNITAKLSVQEVEALIKASVLEEFEGFSIKSIEYNMSEEGNERNAPYGHKFDGVTISLERAHKYGSYDR